MENSKFLGVDLSEHNPNIDFTKLKNNGIDFVILRTGYGKVITQKDKLFEDYYQKAKSAKGSYSQISGRIGIYAIQNKKQTYIPIEWSGYGFMINNVYNN